MTLLISGWVALDDLETPFERVERVLGGPASYAALAASLFTDVRVLAGVGDDFPAAFRDRLDRPNVDLAGLTTDPGETSRWGARYGYDMNSRETLFTVVGVNETWAPALPPGWEDSTTVFLAAAHPVVQREIIASLPKARASLVDTILFYIESALADVRKTMSIATFATVNESEARMISGVASITRASRKLIADGAQRLIVKARALYASEDFGVELANTVYALDATTIDLCLSMFPWAPFRSTKAAVKLHTLLDLRGSIPTFIHISDGKLHDVNVLDLLIIESGAFYIMDRGYLDFERLYALDQAGGFFVTRAKRNLDARRLYSAPVDRNSGLICDQRIVLNGYYAAKHYPGHLRRIRYRDPETGKRLVFLTNQFALPPLTICALYKCRWQVELFFK